MKLKPHHHWQLHRLSSLFLTVTLPFLGIFLLTLKGSNYHQVMMMFRNPALAAFLGLTIAIGLYHTMSEFQVIIRDYLRDSKAKVALGLVYTTAIFLMAVTLHSLIGIMYL